MALLDDVRIYLDIESLDSFTQQKLNLIIANGKQRLRKIVPDWTDEDFENRDCSANSLLLDYCRYARSNASEIFLKNYREELLQERQEYEVRAEEALSDED
ncbi:MAG: hypothetical protein IJT79_08380 [Ruminococcus sp.]|nr:hypothetical protein [Ruminococcus sp.]